ncbi:MAG: 2-oxo acid dehydrogenase subunit E2 [Bdellovibrionaceae bacterium]|nr:2-oxo acid dehydrogenase subunit E2 [Pseudobdellovibrionaceae bacterium]
MKASHIGTFLGAFLARLLKISPASQGAVCAFPASDLSDLRFSVHENDAFSEAAYALVKKEVEAEMKVSFFAEIDLTNVERVRDAFAIQGLKKPSYTAFVTRAVSTALKEMPQLNRRTFRPAWRWFGRKRIQQFHHIDVTVQAEREVEGTETATFADTIRDANRMSLSELQSWLECLRDSTLETNQQWSQYHWLVTRLPGWLSRRLLSLPLRSANSWSKYRGGAVLINSPARYGVDFIAGTWPWPLTISFGLVKERPIVRDHRVVAAPTFQLIFSFDRTVVAGAQAARFFRLIADKLEKCGIPATQGMSVDSDMGNPSSSVN